MRERQMREQVERFLERQMRKTMMPAALGLGLALADCGHRSPPDAGPHSARLAGADEVEGDLRRPEGVAIYSAPGPPRPPARNKYDKLSEVGQRTFAALNQCDFAFLRAAILTRDELSSIASEVPPDAQRYQRMVEAWLEKLRQDLCTPPPEPVLPGDGYWQPQPAPRPWIGDFQVQDVLFVSAGAEWKRPVAIGLVTAYVFPPGSARRSDAKAAPFTFIDFQDRWRLLVK